LANPSAWQVDFAVSVLRSKGVIAYPTESVWGLGCDPYSARAVEQLLALKTRPMNKGVILISGVAEHFDFLLQDLNASQRARFFCQQDRPTTWLIPDRNHRVPVWIKGEHEMVAVRVSDHPVVKHLTQKFGGAIVSTSANPAGKPTAHNRLRLMQYFSVGPDEALNFVVPSMLDCHGRPSTIKNLITNETLRA